MNKKSFSRFKFYLRKLFRCKLCWGVSVTAFFSIFLVNIITLAFSYEKIILEELEILFVIALIVTVVLMFVIGFFVLTPLLRIRESLLLASNDLTHPKKYLQQYTYKNEIDDVVDGVNQLLDKIDDDMQLLRTQERELIDANKNLEFKVERRTLALKETNQSLRQEVIEKRKAQREIEDTALFYTESPNPVMRFSEQGVLLQTNQAGRPLENFWKISVNNSLPEEWKKIAEHALLTNKVTEIEIECDKQVFVLSFVPIAEKKYINLYAVDITLRKQQQEEISHLTTHEAVTGLPNRHLFLELLEQMLNWAKQDGQLVAVIVICVKNFSSLNKTLGHQTSDKFLKTIAKKLQQVIPNESVLACVADNEFVCAFGNVEQTEQVGDVVRNIAREINGHYQIEQAEIDITINQGIAFYPHDAEQASDLLKNASVALYYTTSSSNQDYYFHLQSMNEEMQLKHQLMVDLHQAIQRDQLIVYYQPQYDIDSKNLCGFEALLRWNHPEHQLVSPDKFIPIAEETGMIIEIGNWVTQKACEQLKQWQQQYAVSLRASVNLSIPQFFDKNLVANLTSIVEKSGISPSDLELELTETVVSEDWNETIKILAELRQTGFSLAIDDFGTGYSAMSYLRHFPVDRLKIDKSFISDIHQEAESLAIADAIIKLGHNLNLEVIAEGIENEQQLQILHAHGCDIAQGYYFSKPVPAEEFALLLAKPKITT